MDFLPTQVANLLDPADAGEAERAWSAFAEAFSPLILRAARMLGGDQDAVMDRYAFVIEHLRKDDYARLRTFVPDGRCLFTTWLAVVARRLCYDHDRARHGRVRGRGASRDRSREKRAARQRLADLVGSDVELSTLPDADSTNPEQAVADNERRDALNAAIGSLDDEDRLIVRLRFDDGLTAREIAEFLGMPSQFHAYRRIDRVLRVLRDGLRARGITGMDG